MVGEEQVRATSETCKMARCADHSVAAAAFVCSSLAIPLSRSKSVKLKFHCRFRSLTQPPNYPSFALCHATAALLGF